MGEREGSERIWSKTLGVDRGQANLYLLFHHIGMYGEKICRGQSNVYAQAISLSGCSLPFLCLSVPWINSSQLFVFDAIVNGTVSFLFQMLTINVKEHN